MQNRFALPLALLLLAGLFTGGCGKAIEGASTPRIAVLPSQLLFERMASGGMDIRELEIRNEGNANLVIRDASIGQPMFEIMEGYEPGMVIEPKKSVFVVVAYTPQGASDRGTLVLEHNDARSRNETRVPLEVTSSAPRLFVNPSPVNFGRVPSGEHRELNVNLTNIGGAPLTISSYLLVGGNGMFVIPPESALSGQVTLAPDEVHTLQVQYDPVDDSYHRAQLVIASNDPNTQEGRTLIEVVGNGAEPCIEVLPNNDGTYDFRERTVGRTTEETFTVRNCSDPEAGQPLDVSSIVLRDDSSPTYELDLLPEFPLVLQPQETSAFLVKFSPTVDLQVEEATLVATSNDPYSPELEILLTGVGTTNECPIARPVCTIVGSGEPAATDIVTSPLATLRCNGTGSEDPDGSIAEYIWSVVGRPDGSTALFHPANGESSEFFVDLAGRYVLQLEVVDDRGCTSEPAKVTVVSRPNETLHIQLVWDTPGDSNPFDTGMGAGSDLDLHFINASQGCWGPGKWDIHFRTREADWGVQGDTSDDPSLDIDDTDGWGPENINLNKPENGATYMVGVHYWDDWGYGTSYATIRIYVFGELLFEARDKPMLGADDWWIVAAISWPGPEITPIDRIINTGGRGEPSCPLPPP